MRKLPGFAQIRAFEAAARLGSFKDAARELALTPTAVSHQIRQLETLCRKQLFSRAGRRIELSEEGRLFATNLSPALDSIADAYQTLCQNSGRRQVTLGAGPIFASRWLVPRLSEFWATNPEVDLWLNHSPLPVWRQVDNYDLAIAWGDGNWPGIVSECLLRIDVSPVFAQSFPDRESIQHPSDLLKYPLLHHRDANGWLEWFNRAGVEYTDGLPGTVFEDSNVLLQAVLSGRGVALGILQFIQDEIAAKRLIKPFTQSVDPRQAYYLIYRADAIKNSTIATVRDWLIRG
jgi:LysR family transcriptional regulator, glycine cleavage system transcriptional activator